MDLFLAPLEGGSSDTNDGLPSFLLRLRDRKIENCAGEREQILVLDPGATTGMALFTGAGEVKCWGHLVTGTIAQGVEAYTRIFKEASPEYVVVEDYRVYASKARSHIHSDLLTPKLIGVIETLCVQQKLFLLKQGAGIVKRFGDNSRLKGFGLWAPGERHAMDAVRHAIYFLAFGSPKVKGYKKERSDEV